MTLRVVRLLRITISMATTTTGSRSSPCLALTIRVQSRVAGSLLGDLDDRIPEQIRLYRQNDLDKTDDPSQTASQQRRLGCIT